MCVCVWCHWELPHVATERVTMDVTGKHQYRLFILTLKNDCLQRETVTSGETIAATGGRSEDGDEDEESIVTASVSGGREKP